MNTDLFLPNKDESVLLYIEQASVYFPDINLRTLARFKKAMLNAIRRKYMVSDKTPGYASLSRALMLSRAQLVRSSGFGVACLNLWTKLLGLHGLRPGMSAYEINLYFDYFNDNSQKFTKDDPVSPSRTSMTIDSAVSFLVSCGYSVILSSGTSTTLSHDPKP